MSDTTTQPTNTTGPAAGHLLISDLDGTLIFHHRISDADRAALNRWHEAGGRLVVATGRSLTLTAQALKDTGLTLDYALMCSGAVVTDGDFNPIDVHPLDRELALDIRDFIAAWPGTALCATFADTVDSVVTRNVQEGHSTELFDLYALSGGGTLEDNICTGLPVWLPSSEELPSPAGYTIDDLEAALKQRYGARIDCHRNLDFIDIAPPGCTKGTGLKRALDLMGNPPLTTHSMGDNFNDLPMHAITDYSVSFPHSPEAVQRSTTYVCDGVADYVNRVLDEMESAR